MGGGRGLDYTKLPPTPLIRALKVCGDFAKTESSEELKLDTPQKKGK